MRWLVVLDPLDGLISKTDTSLAVINRARVEGIEVDTATIEELYFEEQARVLATGADGSTEPKVLGGYDLIFMRKEPPYDMRFHYATHLLSLSNTLVLNSPSALRDFNEKLYAANTGGRRSIGNRGVYRPPGASGGQVAGQFPG